MNRSKTENEDIPTKQADRQGDSVAAPFFRVWDGEKMHEPPHDYHIAGDGTLIRKGHPCGDGVTKLLYTHQRDHDHNPIYQGDIIKTVYDDILYVEFNTINSQFELRGRDDMDWSLLHKCCPQVVGDRYQNPKLLKGAA